MKIICGKIGLPFLVPQNGSLLIVSHYGTMDTGNSRAVMEMVYPSLYTRELYMSDLASRWKSL